MVSHFYRKRNFCRPVNPDFNQADDFRTQRYSRLCRRLRARFRMLTPDAVVAIRDQANAVLRAWGVEA